MAQYYKVIRIKIAQPKGTVWVRKGSKYRFCMEVTNSFISGYMLSQMLRVVIPMMHHIGWSLST